eukprot:TRINITY_DN11631_c0_g1_i2.p2 TRINITY_DN11631_c0_g1~~TRINITY_DN11631_c0_g1_i2.p2  ORF type:complete len:346 (+),score=96.96 TRINITY_DN11631_c0_g1_i2:49-1086(+)
MEVPAAKRRRHERVRVAIVGDVLMDIVAQGVPHLPEWGHDTESTSIGMFLGGSAANAARHCASLGLSVSLLSAVGDDDVGCTFLSALDRDPPPGLERWSSGKRLGVVEGCSTGCCIVLSGSRDRAFVTSNAQNDVWQPAPALLQLERPQHLHIGGLFSCEEAATPRLLADGVTVSLDTQWDASGDWGCRKDGSGLVREMLGEVSMFMPNQAELTAILEASGMLPPAAAGAEEGVDEAVDALINAACRLMRAGAVIVLKLGPSGAAGARVGAGGKPAERWRQKAVKVPVVVDTTGAGDAFNAGVLQEWLRSGDVGAALAAGVQLGAAAVQRLGACTQPLTPADLKK